MTTWDVYKAIFDLRADDFVLEGVRVTGGRVNRAGDKTKRFTAILSAPAPLESLPLSESVQVVLVNRARKVLKKLAGPDLVFPVKWEIQTRDGKTKKKMFNFAGSLTPLTVLGFDVSGGRYYIKAEMHGLFY
jgi:hypothetical protein